MLVYSKLPMGYTSIDRYRVYGKNFNYGSFGPTEIPYELLKEAARSATLKLMITPVFTGAAYKNKGVELLLDAVIDSLKFFSKQKVPPLKNKTK